MGCAIMTNKEKLWYLINGLLDGSYTIDVFAVNSQGFMI